ncbi:hypothetical protein IEQ34_011289 [Dendrobium chrysotoxum]|uniref:Uncharacterized protein n=1 Tax=Dendrobium chrysotoxum TaxID=161865 RepID=A0AAV7GX44_DENCH|nr:hypothetical protein IEQ34_011289 [Dendrobium chrysotoxum]
MQAAQRNPHHSPHLLLRRLPLQPRIRQLQIPPLLVHFQCNHGIISHLATAGAPDRPPFSHHRPIPPPSNDLQKHQSIAVHIRLIGDG